MGAARVINHNGSGGAGFYSIIFFFFFFYRFPDGRRDSSWLAGAGNDAKHRAPCACARALRAIDRRRPRDRVLWSVFTARAVLVRVCACAFCVYVRVLW